MTSSVLKTILISAILTFFCIAAQLYGEEKIRTVRKDFSGFNGIYLKGDGIIRIKQSDTFSFSATADEDILRNTDVTVNGDVLVISYLKDISYEKVPEYTIEMPSVRAVYAQGKARIINDGIITGGTVTIKLDGKSECRLVLDVDRVDLGVKGESRCELEGKGNEFYIKVNGDSRVIADRFRVDVVKLQMLGNGKTDLYVKELLDVEMRGRANVTYRGTPRINSKIEGAGRIESIPYEPAASEGTSSRTEE